jgi:hypothetical protein
LLQHSEPAAASTLYTVICRRTRHYNNQYATKSGREKTGSNVLTRQVMNLP